MAESEVYQETPDYAAAKGIILDQGYIVWVVDGDVVMQSGDGSKLKYS